MFSDAVLAKAVGCEPKWLYNAARRIKRPLGRTVEDVFWWRLTHHLAADIGVSVADAAKGADALLLLSYDAGRVRIGATRDDSVAVLVDLPRFHDSSSLAIAAAIQTAVPRRRGRPRKPKSPSTTGGSTAAGQVRQVDSARIEQVLRAPSVVAERPNTARALRILESLLDHQLDIIVSGSVAEFAQGLTADADSVDVITGTSGSRAVGLAEALNGIQALPRGVACRAGFVFDSLLVRSVDFLALQVGSMPLNIAQPAEGDVQFRQIRESAVSITFRGKACWIHTASDSRFAPR